MIGFLKTFPSGLNICGKGRLLYFNGHQQDQSMLLLHFLLFRLKDEANFEKKKKKKKLLSQRYWACQTKLFFLHPGKTNLQNCRGPEILS